VLTIPPSAYKLQIPGLAQEPLSLVSREVLLGSSRPPAEPALDVALSEQPRLLTTEPAPEAERRSAPLPEPAPKTDPSGTEPLEPPPPETSAQWRPFAAFARAPRRGRRERRRER
jgi:hypothetical protein